MTKRVFLIHGWEGRPDNHWFPWLSWELKARGFEVTAVGMPEPDQPKVVPWIKAIKDAVGRSNKDTFFVGHSLGCISILRYLETLPKQAHVGGVLFVAGFSGNLQIPEIEEFYVLPIDMEKARLHYKKAVAIFSDNDSYISVNESIDFAKKTGAKAILEKGKGHFTKREGVDSLPSVFSSLMGMAR